MRVSGGLQDTGSDVIALAFLDLRSPDGHVERWQGPGRIGAVPDESNVIAALQLWAVEASDQSAFDIACDVARDFRLPEPPAVDQLRCDEVVFEWNHARRAC